MRASQRYVVALALLLLVVLVVVLVFADRASARDRVDRMPQPALERAAIRAVAVGGVRSSRYGDATPWVKRLSRELVERAFAGDARRWALCVVARESGWNPGAISATNDHGLAQINRPSHRGISYARLVVDPPYAVAVFVGLSDGGANRSPWRGGSHAC